MESKKTNITLRHVLIVAIAAVVIVSAVVFAAYIMHAGELKNIFTPADSDKPEIKETFKDNIKNNVYFQVEDKGYTVYVRAKLVITWKDEDGVIYFANPEKDTDYELDLNLTDGWVYGEDDGYYYYTIPVDSGKTTGVLINSCTQLQTPYDGYTLSVEVIAQTIQAAGRTDGDGVDPDTEIPAYRDAWQNAPDISAEAQEEEDQDVTP